MITVPAFIDLDDKFASIFGVPRRHDNFLFDKQGKLVSRAIGIRTKDQLSEMVKKAGVQ
jgi:hypothetical protein